MNDWDWFAVFLVILLIIVVGLVVYGVVDSFQTMAICDVFGYEYVDIADEAYCVRIVDGVAEYVPWIDLKLKLVK